MVIKHFFIGSILGLLLIGCSDTTGGDVPEGYVSRSGKKIYMKRCTSCHGEDGKLCASGSKDLTKSKMDSLSMVKMIKNGGNGMPRQKQYFKTDGELSNTIEYVKSLRK